MPESQARRTTIVLPKALLRRIDRVERLPQNRDGADKSWVWPALRGSRDHLERARRVR